ncbi:MAG: hypothetical protein ABSA39_00785 [Edaphobacter sp.]
MLDVHTPHEKIRGFRDFLLHLFTITVGLLIALALEGCVERWHHRELRNEADANLRQEIRDNEQALATIRNAVIDEKKNLVSVAKSLQSRSQDKPFDAQGVNLNFTNSTLSDASWRTAAGTGALSFMEYGRVQQFASVYQEQELFSRLEWETLDRYLQLNSYAVFGFDPKTMSPEEAKAALPDVSRTITHLVAMDQVGESLQRGYERVLAAR